MFFLLLLQVKSVFFWSARDLVKYGCSLPYSIGHFGKLCVVGFLETPKLKTFLLTTITQFFFFWVHGNFLMYLALLLVIFLELNNNCGMCSIANTQLGWMSHILGPWDSVTCCHTCPPGLASYQKFVGLSICEDQMLLFAMPSLTTKNDAAYLKKMCCLIVHIEINCLFCHPLSPLVFHPFYHKGFIIYLSDIIVQSLHNMNAYNINTKIYCRKQEISAECLWRPIFAKTMPFSNSCKGTTNSSSTRISQNMQYTY